eukprot:1359260-Pyramimonas_sp.AAC.1
MLSSLSLLSLLLPTLRLRAGVPTGAAEVDDHVCVRADRLPRGFICAIEVFCIVPIHSIAR